MDAVPEYTPLDDTDRAILQLLQRDARNFTAVEIADLVGVSDSTVRNRIENLEDRGVIEGYVPMIDYELAGYQLQIKITCTAPIEERESLAQQALQVEGVIEVDEIMNGRENIEVTAVVPTHKALTDISKALAELGVDVEQEKLIRHHYFRPFDHFGTKDVGESDAGSYDI